jgi:uncharacterized protein YgfB (UPF0149 family)
MELTNNEYIIELDDVINNSEFEETDLKEVYGDSIDFFLEDASSKVYSIMYSAFPGIDKERQYAGIQYLINNDEDKIAGLQKAIIEYIRGDLSMGLGLNLYTDKKHYSDEVVNILKRNGLWIVAELQYQDEDIA